MSVSSVVRKMDLQAFSARCQWLAAQHWQMSLIIFVLALGLRVSFALTLPARIVWPDGHRYENVAMNLLTAHEFGSLADNYMSVPTQPLLIAAVYRVFGQNYVALRLLFAVFGAITCVLAYVIGKQLFTPPVGAVAGLLLACYPYYIYVSTLFEYPQAFFILMMAFAFLGLFAFATSSRLSTLWWAGLCLGLAVLSVPTVLLFLPFVFMWLAYQLYPQAKLVLCSLILLLGIGIPTAPWALRNYVAMDI
jgi:4-amino-4-deoxy-L-arabinose transferase-like glycosyltransferase